MALRTLLGQVGDAELKKLPSRLRNPERVQQSIDAFALFLTGVSYRGIAEHFGWKSPNTAVNSVRRGEKICKDLQLDKERIRLKLAAAFEEILNASLDQIRQQQQDGQVLVVTDNQGNESVSRRRGIDVRLLGEAGRGAMRMAEFCGLLDKNDTPGGSDAISQSVIFVSPATDGASWDEQVHTVDVSAANVPASDPETPQIESSTGDTAASKATEGEK